MLKIENQVQNAVEFRYGWYLDNEGEPWFFDEDGDPRAYINGDGKVYFVSNASNVFEYEPFTRLTGKIIISNEGL